MTTGVETEKSSFARQRLEFTYTQQDYIDANRVHLFGRRSRGWGKGLLGWIIFVVGFTTVSWLNSMGKPSVAPTTAPSGSLSPIRVLLPLIPWLAIFGAFWFFVLRRMRNLQSPSSFLYTSQAEADTQLTSRGKDSGLRGKLFWIVSAAVAVTVIQALIPKRGDTSPPPVNQDSTLLGALVPILPWLLIFGFIWFFVLHQLRGKGSILQGWKSSPHFQRPVAFEIFDAGTSWTNAVSRIQYKWDAYVRVRESPTLFLLYTGYTPTVIVPKRAFASKEAITAFRELVRWKVASRSLPAFPVTLTPHAHA